MTEHKARKQNLTEHGFPERGCDEGAELTVSTCKGSQEDSDRFVVKLVGEDDLTAMLSHHRAISCMNGAGYWEG